MKRFSLSTAIFLLSLFLVRGTPAQAQTAPSTDNHTAREEAEGKEIWDKIQAKQLECKNITDDNYDSLGEYFMGQSIGNTQRHALMNQMMTNMMGEEGEEQMHVVMGKRLSGCQSDAQIPQGGVGFMPMMGYGGWNGFGILGWLPLVLFWTLLILGVIVLIRYLGSSARNTKERSPLDILKERYAKGEIDKKEFEQMKKDLT